MYKQTTYGVELVNNANFKAWTTADWEQSWMYESCNTEGSECPPPAWSDTMTNYWEGDSSKNLRTTD